MTDSKSSIQAVYRGVVGDVITSVKEIFLEDGVDDQVLEQLKELWQSKLLSTIKPEKPVPVVPTLPVQILIPSPAGEGTKVLVNVPTELIKNNHLRHILTPDLIKSVVNFPQSVAADMIQDSVNKYKPQPDNTVHQIDGLMDCDVKVQQFDGANNSSSSSDEGDISVQENENEDSEDNEDDEDDYPAIGKDEELNSDDDLTEESDMDCDNIIVCQYEKILKCRNHWKFFFKDGIMNINGQETAFKKATGEGRW